MACPVFVRFDEFRNLGFALEIRERNDSVDFLLSGFCP